MAIIDAAAQDVGRKVKLSWAEVQGMANDLADRWRGRVDLTAVYGVPRGGIPVACLVAPKLGLPIFQKPRQGCLVVDDLIDSGRTIQHYSESGFHTDALLNKAATHNGKWVVFPWEQDDESEGPERNIVRLLQFIGEDPTRDGLLETPKRVLKAWRELTSGYQQDYKSILNKSFEQPHDELVLLRGVEFHSTCEHHLLPFYGTAAVGYIPIKTVVGISKLARLVECFARRLQIQERLTKQIADAIVEVLQPLGVGVVIQAKHSCMGCRGVMKPDSDLVTSVMLGNLRDNAAARAEFLSLVTR